MTIQTYIVHAIHPAMGIAYDVELVASSERGAISRTMLSLMHRDRDADWLDGSFIVTDVAPFMSGQRRS